MAACHDTCRIKSTTTPAVGLCSFAAVVASINAVHTQADQYHQHAAVSLRQSPPFEQPLRNLAEQHVMVSIETSHPQVPCRPHAISDDTLLAEPIGTDTCGEVLGRGIHEQLSDSDAERTTSIKSAKRNKRRRPLSPSLSRQPKTEKEQESRSRSAACLQNMEDFLLCVLSWKVPKNQAQGNVKKSGLTGDKQQTMEAFHILSEVLVRHAISPLQPQPGETCIQAVAREAKHQIEIHLSDKSAIVLPTHSLMADGTSFGGPLCTITPDHKPCLPDKTSACINCRKERRGKAYKENVVRLLASHSTASFAASSLSTH
ncbi:hypothetical protein Q7P35_005562 [Cladosporium inversicolor]